MMARWLLAASVALHLAHGWAHDAAGVDPTTAQRAVIGLVTVGLAVAAFLPERWLRLLAVPLLVVSIAYGGAYHYVMPGHDNIFGGAHGEASVGFALSALGLTLVESWALGVLVHRRVRRRRCCHGRA